MIENSHLNHFIESKIKSEYLSIPTKTILLEEGKVAEKLYIIREGCLRLFFYNEGKDITFQFFLRGILSPHSIVCINARRVFFTWKVSNQRN